jgi:hypothetical protein
LFLKSATTAILLTAAGTTGVIATDKSSYNLFQMTPPELRRTFETDRGVASPYTLDAGAYSFGVSAGYSYRDHTSPGLERINESYDYGSAVLKAGILNNFDLGVMLPYYQTKETTYKSPFGTDRFRDHGITDTWLTGKYNFWGNDGGPTAWSLSSLLKFPTACDEIEPCDDYEGGLDSVFAWWFYGHAHLRLVNGFLLSDHRYWQSSFCNDICFYSPPLFSKLNVYCGFDSFISTRNRSNWEGQFKAGFIYRLTAALQLFAESSFGVNGRVPDYRPVIGFDFRY